MGGLSVPLRIRPASGWQVSALQPSREPSRKLPRPPKLRVLRAGSCEGGGFPWHVFHSLPLQHSMCYGANKKKSDF